MRAMNHNWSATKQYLHPQSVAEISRHSVLSGDRIRQCGTSPGSRHKDTDVLKRSLSAHWMQVKLFLSLLIWIADCRQFLSDNHLNGCKIFGWFGFLKTQLRTDFPFSACHYHYDKKMAQNHAFPLTCETRISTRAAIYYVGDRHSHSSSLIALHHWCIQPCSLTGWGQFDIFQKGWRVDCRWPPPAVQCHMLS